MKGRMVSSKPGGILSTSSKMNKELAQAETFPLTQSRIWSYAKTEQELSKQECSKCGD
jgi:hypothetical protein